MSHSDWAYSTVAGVAITWVLNMFVAVGIGHNGGVDGAYWPLIGLMATLLLAPVFTFGAWWRTRP